jgi:hypothetical protein
LATGLGDRSGFGVEPALGEPRQDRRFHWSKLLACHPQGGKHVIGPDQRCLMSQSHGQPTALDLKADHCRPGVELALSVLGHPLHEHGIPGEERLAGRLQRCHRQICQIHLPARPGQLVRQGPGTHRGDVYHIEAGRQSGVEGGPHLVWIAGCRQTDFQILRFACRPSRRGARV